ncbi:MAG: DNA repair exonuclease [Desulfurococcales archaeon]|nr:DNA repair exonuclease [Desulfurococcales archaeon]
MGFRQYGIEERELDIYSLFEEAVSTAVKEGVKAIVISGDMFDKPRPPNRAIKIANDVLKKACDSGIRVYSILGEHDLPKRYDLPPQTLIPYLRLLGTSRTPKADVISYEGREYLIAGISHHPPRMKYLEALKKALNDLKFRFANGIAVLMLHQNIRQFFMFEEGLDLADIPPEVTYVAMGHLHRRICRKLENGTTIAYAGSIDILRADEITSWREEGKGFYIVDLSSGEAIVHKVDLEVRPQAVVKTDYRRFKEDLKLTLNSLGRSSRKGIIHAWITVPYNLKDDIVREVRKVVSDRAYVRVRLERIVEGVQARGRELAEVDPLGIVASLLSRNPGDRRAREAAAAILKIKDILAGESEEDIEVWIEKLLQYKELWADKIGKLEPVPVSYSRILKGSGKGLERFLR